MSGLFPGDKYTFEVKSVSKQQTSSEKRATAVLGTLQYNCYCCYHYMCIAIRSANNMQIPVEEVITVTNK